MHSRTFGNLLITLLSSFVGVSSPRAQGLSASGTISAATAGGGSYNYTIIVSNGVGASVSVGSFWYAWVPGQYYLPTAPSSVQVPTGWGDNIANSDVSSIQYFASSSSFYISPGSTLSFGFTSTNTPAVIFGNAPNHPGTPIGTTVFYSSNFSGSQQTSVITPVPEPCALALLLAVIGAFGIIRTRDTPPRN